MHIISKMNWADIRKQSETLNYFTYLGAGTEQVNTYHSTKI